MMGNLNYKLGVLPNLEILLIARILPLLLYKRDLNATLKTIDVGSDLKFENVLPDIIRDRVMSVTRRPWLMRNRRCLRQGILGMRYLRKAGYNPVLKFGIDTRSVSKEKIAAHCWVELNGKPLINDIMDHMVVIHTVPEPEAQKSPV
jgi:Transglutaminase-like superfamily